MYTTYGESPNVDGGTTTITKCEWTTPLSSLFALKCLKLKHWAPADEGASTLTVEGPSYLTLTFYPTTTTYQTSTVKVPTTTKTKTHTPTASSTSHVCLPGDASKKEHTGLTPTHDQSITLCEFSFRRREGQH